MYSATAIYWRAIRRMKRRAATVHALAPLGPVRPHCAECDHAQLLLREAVRVCNALAPDR